MIYLEFVERDRSIPIEIFRQLGNQASAWAEGARDRMILQLGRTLRLGPAPSYSDSETGGQAGGVEFATFIL